ncbi:MAG: glycerol-3-phosphate dehydrogenase, partial [Spirochaetes bacterium]|nr:glycerol-3-phosphate dehydrogenase [Spirochaetota bacterium]
MIKDVTIFGCGSWGSAVALLLAGKGINVNIWEYNKDVINDIKNTGYNNRYLKGIKFPDNIRVTGDIQEAISENNIFIFVIPSHTLRGFLDNIEEFLPENPLAVSLIKGIEQGTLKRMSEIIRETSTKIKRIVVLSGPSHAEEVSRNIPTT